MIPGSSTLLLMVLPLIKAGLRTDRADRFNIRQTDALSGKFGPARAGKSAISLTLLALHCWGLRYYLRSLFFMERQMMRFCFS